MPRLAIVISAVGSIESLEGTLVSVLENRPADCEILVALNQPYADPYALQGEVRFLPADRRHSAITRIHQALAASKAPFVHLLSSGCTATEGWADEALERFGDRQVASVAPLVVTTGEAQTIFAAGVGYRTSGKRVLVGQGQAQWTSELQSTVVGPALMAAFYRRAAIDFLGGFSGQLGLRHADVDLAIALRHLGFTTAVEPHSQVSADVTADPAESAFAQALHDERLFWRNLPVAGSWKAMAAHAASVAGETITSFGRPRMISQLIARGLGCCQVTGHRRHRRALEELSRRAIRPKAATAGQDRMRIDRPHNVPAPSEASPLGAHVR